jgi:hypothetical protein
VAMAMTGPFCSVINPPMNKNVKNGKCDQAEPIRH